MKLRIPICVVLHLTRKRIPRVGLRTITCTISHKVYNILYIVLSLLVVTMILFSVSLGP